MGSRPILLHALPVTKSVRAHSHQKRASLAPVNRTLHIFRQNSDRLDRLWRVLRRIVAANLTPHKIRL